MDQARGPVLTSKICIVLVVLLTAVGCIRIVSSYGTLNQTYDESAHLARGLEWLGFGTYNLEYLHPPLARVFVAIGPYALGVRPVPGDDVWNAGSEELYSRNAYWQNLTAARLGNLPFFILGCFTVYWWSARIFSRTTAVVAVFLFSTLPPVLGHAGVATLDMACCASVALAVFCIMRWTEQPGWGSAAALGVALAIALLSKLSCVGYIPASIIVIAAAYWFIARPSWAEVAASVRRRTPQLAIAALIALFVIWAGYRFSIRTLDSIPVFQRVAAQAPALRKISHIPLPYTELFLGLSTLMYYNNHGLDSYLLGHYSRKGWWYFFPVVVATKTPIGLLILAIAGIALARRWIDGPHAAMRLATVLGPLGILAVAMSSRINLGVRHILPIYPFLVIVAAQVAVWVFYQLRSKPVMAAVAVLLTFDLAQSSAAGVDQLAFFNPLAGSHPEKILCESDLDWGQDLHRLAQRLKELRTPRVSLSYFGQARPEAAGLPPFTKISGTEPVTGYLAVSIRTLALDSQRDGTFQWLKGVEPRERIGRTIFLYYLEPGSSADRRAN
jgi:hypothetical protein